MIQDIEDMAPEVPVTIVGNRITINSRVEITLLPEVDGQVVLDVTRDGATSRLFISPGQDTVTTTVITPPALGE